MLLYEIETEFDESMAVGFMYVRHHSINGLTWVASSFTQVTRTGNAALEVVSPSGHKALVSAWAPAVNWSLALHEAKVPPLSQPPAYGAYGLEIVGSAAHTWAADKKERVILPCGTLTHFLVNGWEFAQLSQSDRVTFLFSLQREHSRLLALDGIFKP